MTFTPLALRLCAEIASAGVRITTPFSVTAKISSWSSTTSAPTTGPLSAVSLMPMTPRPPRYCVRYSSTGVRLPKPLAVRWSSDAPPPAMLQATTSSPGFLNRMPKTPAAGLPVSRTLDSSKRIVWPSRDDSKMSSSPLVGTTSASSSSSLSRIAIRPARLEES